MNFWKTIQKTLRYLEIHDPKNATRDYAVGFLKFMQRFAHVASKAEDLILRSFLKIWQAKTRKSMAQVIN